MFDEHLLSIKLASINLILKKKKKAKRDYKPNTKKRN